MPTVLAKILHLRLVSRNELRGFLVGLPHKYRAFTHVYIDSCFIQEQLSLAKTPLVPQVHRFQQLMHVVQRLATRDDNIVRLLPDHSAARGMFAINRT